MTKANIANFDLTGGLGHGTLDDGTPITRPFKAPVPPRLNLDNLSSKLAVEVALGLIPLNDILANFGITGEEWEALIHNEHFRELLQTTEQEIKSAVNTPKRIKLKASIIVEQALTVLHSIAHNTKAPEAVRIEAVKQAAMLASIGGKEQGPSGDGFSITINVGANQQPVTIDHNPAQTE